MEKYTIDDLVSNHQCSCLSDMLHVCKRYKNVKRDYLFVNEFQGKHVPVAPLKVYASVWELYSKAYKELKGKQKILFIGFAETATAIGELMFYYATCSDSKLNAVAYVHTTREHLDCQELINFQEEHSHATEQRLFIKDADIDFDTVVFVEDEISTGNTILNAIKKFENKKHIKNYYVLSFANWQSKEDKGVFSEFEKERNLNVKFIALHTGELKNRYAMLDMPETNIHASVGSSLNSMVEIDYYDCYDARSGITSEELKENYQTCSKIAEEVLNFVESGDKVEVIGTEEFMGFPLRVAKEIEESGVECKFHATTRSPIQSSEESIIKDWSKPPSAYESDRVTYLYNMTNRDYNKIVVVTDGELREDFKKAFEKFGVSVIFIKVHAMNTELQTIIKSEVKENTKYGFR